MAAAEPQHQHRDTSHGSPVASPPPASGPGGDTTNNQSEGLKAAKDRQCPFCGQPFTSSSLGRHLDLFIKAKNPKPPDGVHDVAEIRKIRGGITRRQPRSSGAGGGSAAHKSDMDADSRSGSVAEWPAQPTTSTGEATRWEQAGTGLRMRRETERGDDTPEQTPAREQRDDRVSYGFNAPNWQATGVINDLPARAPSRTGTYGSHGDTPIRSQQAQRAQDMRKDGWGQRIERPEYPPMSSVGVDEDTWKLQEAAEVGRAAELALREVLASLEAAKRKVEGPNLYDFDFCSMTFPGLCLALLPPPPTLFSSTPFPAAHTWARAPPREPQFEALNRAVSERINTVREEAETNDAVPSSLIFRLQVHLQNAYEHWQFLSESEKAAAWDLEVMRAFVRERDGKAALQSQLEAAQQRIRHLEAEYDRLSRFQLPREYLMHPPQTARIPPPVMKMMQTTDTVSGAREASYDADALIGKWRAAYKASARSSSTRPAASASLVHAPVSSFPTTTTTTYSARPRSADVAQNRLRGDMIINGSVFAVNGAMPRDVHHDDSPVTYQTPDHPGAVIEDDEEAQQHAEDAETSIGPLTRSQRRDDEPRSSAPADLGLNGNRKRPFGPSGANGRRQGVKILRALES